MHGKYFSSTAPLRLISDPSLNATHNFSRAMLHDENIYPDSHTFTPERFLTKGGKLNLSVKDPLDAVFGFGRRVCAGKPIALSSIW